MNKKNKIRQRIMRFLLCSVTCVSILTGNNMQAEAADTSKLDYGIQPLMPENQRSQTQAYFDLLMEPGQEQTLEVKITNYAEEDKTINVSVATASTNSGGVADYGVRSNVEADDTLLYKMEDLVSTEGRIVVPAGETHTVQLKVLAPSSSFDGILAGGINFKEEVEEAEQEKTTEAGVTIINEYTYVVALLMRNNEAEVQPDLQLNKVFATQSNAKNVVSANIQNILPAYVTDMKIGAAVKKQGSEEALYELDQEQMEMAPNSNFNYLIPLNGKAFEAGDYILSMEVVSNEGSWSFQQEFTITAEEARKLNETDVSIEKSKLWLYMTIGAGILAFLFLIFFLILRRKRTKKQKKRLRELIDEIISRIKGQAI